MDQEKVNGGGEEARDLIDHAVVQLIDHREHINFAQVSRLLREAIPVRLSGAVLLSLGVLVGATFTAGWQLQRMYQTLVDSTPPPSKSSPKEAVDQYFAFVSSGQYEQAFGMIAKGSFDSWYGFWSKVKHVAIQESITEKQNDHEAVVRVEIKVRKIHDEVVLEKAKVYLGRNAPDDPWKINSYERISSR